MLLSRLLNENMGDSIHAVFYKNGWPGDLTAFQNMTPPQLYFQMKTRVVAGIKAHIKALELAIKGEPGAMKM